MKAASAHRRIKVLQLHPAFNVRQHDFADLAEQIFHGLPTEQFETVSAYLSGQPGPGDAVSSAERSVYFKLSDRQLKGWRLQAMWQLYRFCRDEGFDVVLCNRFKPLSMMLALNRWLRIPLCVGITHSIGEYGRRYRRRQVARRLDHRWRMVGVSGAVRDYLLKLDCGFTANNTVTIPNAIDVQQAITLQYSQAEARQRLGLPPAPALLVGTIGRLVPVKGHRYLVDAFAGIADRFPDSHLVIVGAGREEQNLRTQIHQAGLANRVHLVGAVPDAMRYVRAFNLWTMPSIQEGFGLALLEGMSGELPIVGTDIPAFRPMLEPAGATMVAPADDRALGSALAQWLAASEAERLKQGRQSHEYLLRHHDIGPYRTAYRQLILHSLKQE